MNSIALFSKYGDYDLVAEGFDKKGFLKEISKSTVSKTAHSKLHKTKSKVSKKGGLADLYESSEEVQVSEPSSDFYNKYTPIGRLL